MIVMIDLGKNSKWTLESVPKLKRVELAERRGKEHYVEAREQGCQQDWAHLSGLRPKSIRARLIVDLKLQHLDFWASLHGQVPGLLDWDMGNECFLAFTTTHLPLAEQNRECLRGGSWGMGAPRRIWPKGQRFYTDGWHDWINILGRSLKLQYVARYKLRIVEPPKLPLEKKPNPDKDGPDFEPNLWMWVDPNIVFPPGKLEVPEPSKGKNLTSIVPSPQPSPKEDDFAKCPQATVVESPSLSGDQYPPRKRFASSPSNWELTEEEEAEDQDDSSSVALRSPHKRAPLQSRRLRQANSQEGGLWSRPPLNYFHLIALALRNSSPCGLNVQQIYSFTRQHFPFFRTAPEGWKNTVRHNLCFRDSFEKVPVSMQGGASTRPRSCLWKLTDEGHRRFAEEARALASTKLETIQQCMSQPDVMPSLFDL
ncbi:forkhead box protein R1 [Mesoplodon densirostris]|uniref:forkhead box protein R1 n=1 Tax=Mesoplodon densirostris TaxID=48708 RepID=UPI0028DBBABC|nr:forkhead box protein R1 [Mesoplodon densirostris]